MAFALRRYSRVRTLVKPRPSEHLSKLNILDRLSNSSIAFASLLGKIWTPERLTSLTQEGNLLRSFSKEVLQYNAFTENIIMLGGKPVIITPVMLNYFMPISYKKP